MFRDAALHSQGGYDKPHIGYVARTCSHYPEHLHDLVAQVVDDLHGDASGLRLLEGARRIAVERRPRVLVDLGLERRLQRAVGIVGPEAVAWRTKKLSSL